MEQKNWFSWIAEFLRLVAAVLAGWGGSALS